MIPSTSAPAALKENAMKVCGYEIATRNLARALWKFWRSERRPRTRDETTEKLDLAFWAGLMARRQGKAVDDNPYDETRYSGGRLLYRRAQYKFWFLGWQAGTDKKLPGEVDADHRPTT